MAQVCAEISASTTTARVTGQTDRIAFGTGAHACVPP
jgi:hypothetical protein